MMKKIIAWVLILLILVAFPGCKQKTETSAAPDEVVETPQTEPVQQELPPAVSTPVKEPSETETPEQPAEPELQDVWVCEFSIDIKPEMAKEQYSVEEFPEFEQVAPDSDPTEFTTVYFSPGVPVTTFQVRAEFCQEEQVRQVIEKLRSRPDYESLRVEYRAYQKPGDQTSWIRPVIENNINTVKLENGEKVADGRIIVSIKDEYFSAKRLFALSDFPEVEAEMMEYYYYYDSKNLNHNYLYIIFYLKECGAESMQKAMENVKTNPLVSEVQYDHIVYAEID